MKRIVCSIGGIVAAVTIGMMPIGAAAQDKYPSKIIHIVVPVAAGGLQDVTARLLAKQLQPRLGQPVIIDNKPGANTTIGANAVLADASTRSNETAGRWWHSSTMTCP